MPPHKLAPAGSAGAWREVEGEFNAIMAVVMPCRSDRSGNGLAPFAHMADGIIHLILVRKCTALQVRDPSLLPCRYLRCCCKQARREGAFLLRSKHTSKHDRAGMLQCCGVGFARRGCRCVRDNCYDFGNLGLEP